jgi:hypothetical protein
MEKKSFDVFNRHLSFTMRRSDRVQTVWIPLEEVSWDTLKPIRLHGERIEFNGHKVGSRASFERFVSPVLESRLSPQNLQRREHQQQQQQQQQRARARVQLPLVSQVVPAHLATRAAALFRREQAKHYY